MRKSESAWDFTVVSKNYMLRFRQRVEDAHEMQDLTRWETYSWHSNSGSVKM